MAHQSWPVRQFAGSPVRRMGLGPSKLAGSPVCQFVGWALAHQSWPVRQFAGSPVQSTGFSLFAGSEYRLQPVRRLRVQASACLPDQETVSWQARRLPYFVPSLTFHCFNPQSAIPNPQSAIPNPQSAIRNPQSAILSPQDSALSYCSSFARDAAGADRCRRRSRALSLR